MSRNNTCALSPRLVPFLAPVLTLALVLASLSPLSAETYITEEKVQIDRCACAWFIARYLDENPTFVFIKQGQKAPAGVTYDFFGADYFHRGPDCSFTGFIKRHIRKKNTALIAVNAIVNDVFAWRNGPNSLSVAIKKHIDHLAAQGKTDQQIYQACMVVFDLVYLARQGQATAMNPSGKTRYTHTGKRLLKHIYGDSVKPPGPQVIDVTTLQQILKTNPPRNNQPLHKLALQVLGHASP